MITADKHLKLTESKMDASWERYHAGRIELVDRYNVTVALVQGNCVLDIGCGQGLLIHLLRQRNGTTCLTGVDISQGEVTNARKLLGKILIGNLADVCIMDAECLDLGDNEFDTVVIGQTLEHVRAPDRAAAEALRVLKPGGRIIVNVPNDDVSPHGNHLHVYHELDDMLDLFGDAINWQGEGRLHSFWFTWGAKR